MDLFEIIRDFLNANGVKFETDEERKVFRFRLSIQSKIKYLRYSILVDENFYVVYAVSPIEADSKDEDVMREIADFLCRANYGLRNGNFEIDMRDGEIRYKSFVDCNGVIPSEQTIRGSVLVPSLMFDRYAPGMLDVIFRGISGRDAIIKCE